METKTNVKAGALTNNHNETLLVAVPVKTRIKAGSVPDAPEFRDTTEEEIGGIRVHSGVKAGALATNHNETLLVAVPVKTRIKAGIVPDGPEFRDTTEEEIGGIRVDSGVKAGIIDPNF